MSLVKRILPNGLKFLSKYLPDRRVVTIQVWVRVGSVNETAREAGLAHLVEHMVFKGTPSQPVGAISRTVEGAGGSINAWTSFDETVYHITLPADQLSTGIAVLADALRHPLFDKQELERERAVVLEEIVAGADHPGRVASKKLFKGVFGPHPYGRPVIGYENVVATASRETLLRFYDKWYQPASQMLVVVGDFESDQLDQLVDAHFGVGPAAPAPRVRAVTVPEQNEMRVVGQSMPVVDAVLAMGMPIGGMAHPHTPLLDLLAAIVGQGGSSRLMSLVRQRALASKASAVAYTPKEAGLFGVFVESPPQQMGDLATAVANELALLTQRPVGVDELNKVRNMLLAEDAFAIETVDGVARKLGYDHLFGDGAAFADQYRAALQSATPSQLLEVAKQIFLPKRLTCAYVTPFSWSGSRDHAKVAGLLKKALERGFVPSKQKRRSKKRSAGVVDVKLPSGDRVIVKPVAGALTFAARAALLCGQRNESARQAGIVSFMSALLTHGAGKWDPSELAAQIDGMGGTLEGFSGRNTFGVAAGFLSEHLDKGLSLLAAALTEPQFLEGEVAREQALFQQMIGADEQNGRQVVFHRFVKTLFGKHPYGWPLIGTDKSVAGFTAEAVSRFHRRALGSGQMVLGVVGGADPERVVARAGELFAERHGAGALKTASSWTPPVGPTLVRRVMERAQSLLVVGFPGTTLSAPDRFALDVAIEVLGGSGGRLFDAVRERASLAYEISSISFEGVDPGYVGFFVGTAAGQEQCLFDVIRIELDRFLKKGLIKGELNRVVRFLIGARKIHGQRFDVQAADLALGALYGLGTDMDEATIKGLAKLTNERVLKVARKYLRDDRMIVSLITPARCRLKL